MKRAVLIIVGIILLLAGLGFTAAGAAVAIVVGSDGAFSADAGRITGPGYALVFNDFSVDTGGSSVSNLVDLTAGANSESGKEVFIGTGPTAEVTKYLEGTARDVVSDLADGMSRAVPIPGTAVPTPPADQTFWTAKAQGTSPSIVLGSGNQNQTLVIMNATPSAPVDIDLEVGLKSSLIFPVGIALGVFGFILILVSIWVFVRAAKARKKRKVEPGAYSTAAVGDPYVAGYPSPPPLPPPPPAAPEPPTQRPSAGGDGPPPGQ